MSVSGAGTSVCRLSVMLLSALVSVCAGSEPATSDAAWHLAAWSDTLPIDPRVISQINRYEHDEGSQFRDGYAADLSAGIRALVFESVRKAIEKRVERGGEPLIEVTYMEAGFARRSGGGEANKAETEFEKSIIRTEFLVFLDARDATPDRALEIYAEPAFRMSASSRIKRIWMDGDLDCVETDGIKFLLSPTLYCSRIDEFRDSTLTAQHSQVVSNGDDYQAVYFKESLKTFVKVPGGIVFHYINYFRGSGMGGVKKSVGRGKIVDSEKRAIEELRNRLSEPGTSRD
jgi:hypothetical protein